MALITKQVLVCNKCGKEVANGSPNMTILGEEFYLCDECLERLLNWVSIPTVQEVDLDKLAAKLNQAPEPKVVTTQTPREKGKRFSTTNVNWDDYNIDKVLTMVEQGMCDEDIGKAMCTSTASIMSLLNRIRRSTPGTDKYKYSYRDRLLKVTRKRGRHAVHMKKKEGEV